MVSDTAVTLGDAEIRLILRETLRKRHREDGHTFLIEELGLCQGQVRVDLAVVNGILHGYEIKSDRDSLRRLPVQIQFYSRIFDKVTIVSGDRHLSEVVATVPCWWGISKLHSVRNSPELRTVRRCRSNPSRDPRALVELLWAGEARSLLMAKQHIVKSFRMPRSWIWDRVCETRTLEEVAACVRERLKHREAAQALALQL